MLFAVGFERLDQVFAAETEPASAGQTMRFSPGGWNPKVWMAIRMPNQGQAVPFQQKAQSIGTTMESFSKEDYGKERDNALLLYDTKLDDLELELTFAIGEGFRAHSSPGVCLAPRVENGVLQGGISVFVATYGLVVWDQHVEGGEMKYVHLGQLARWSDPAQKHTLTCRVSKKAKSVAIRLDDSDVLAFQFVGNPRLSFIKHELNSKVALWGCHGACDFYELKVRTGSLSFVVREGPVR
jgi:hypothetical protein